MLPEIIRKLFNKKTKEECGKINFYDFLYDPNEKCNEKFQLSRNTDLEIAREFKEHIFKNVSNCNCINIAHDLLKNKYNCECIKKSMEIGNYIQKPLLFYYFLSMPKSDHPCFKKENIDVSKNS